MAQTALRAEMDVMEDLRKKLNEDLQCPVCLKIPRKTPIYQCKSGHIHCKECHPKLTKCPICRSTKLSTRALMTEKLIERLPLKCSFEENGCSEPAKLLENQTKHEKNCEYRNVPCIFKGWNRFSSCNVSVPMNSLIEHIKKEHPFLTSINDIETFDSRVTLIFGLKKSDGTWKNNPQIIALKFKGTQFFLVTDWKYGTFNIYIVMVGSENEAKRIKGFIKVLDKSVVCLIDTEPKLPTLILPKSFLERGMDVNSEITVTLHISTHQTNEKA